jgi:hypothetical protein
MSLGCSSVRDIAFDVVEDVVQDVVDEVRGFRFM